MPSQLSPTKQKILLLLFSGLALGLTYSPRRQLKIIKYFAREWKKIEERKLEEEIRALYRAKLVAIQENPDGLITLKLNEVGKIRAITYHFEQMRIHPRPWDKKWRLVVFDIPEKLRKGRDALRGKLKNLGFYELQKSVFVFPHECRQEIEFLIEFFRLRPFVRYGLLETIDNEPHLKKIFKIL